MASVVSICNLALSNLGKDNISSIDEAGAEARACRQFYEHTRDTLQVYPWRFAGKTQALAELANDKPGAWGYAYKRPVDCLKVRWLRQAYSTVELYPQDESIQQQTRYEVEGERIYAGISPAFLRYTWRITDPTKFPPLFIDALSAALSVRLAMPLTRDPKVRADAYNLAQAMRATAETADANEEREGSDISTEFVGVRSNG
jgi:hypothetical protein